VRQIDLGPDFVRLKAAGSSAFGGAGCFGMRMEMLPDLFCLMLFERAGVGLLFGDPYFCQDIENCLAFDFELPGQVVNSNLAHPPSVSSDCSR